MAGNNQIQVIEDMRDYGYKFLYRLRRKNGNLDARSKGNISRSKKNRK